MPCLKRNGGSTVSSAMLSEYCHISCELQAFDSTRSMYEKDAEFRTWLVEERMVNPETMSKDQTKKEFARFVEDYNTGVPWSRMSLRTPY